jgi:hypothetical protein
MAIKLIYKDIAVGADDDATVTTTAQTEAFGDISRLPYGVDAEAVATLEPNGWGLSGDYKVLDRQRIAFWSTARSGADCLFDNPPQIVLEFTEQYTTTGLSVQFAPNVMEYCAEFSVAWYQNGAVKSSGTYYPTAGVYVIQNKVEAFDKLVFTFKRTSLPHKRLKIDWLSIGVIRQFTGKELKSATFRHETNLIGDYIPSNVLDASFRSSDSIDYVFQRKQPVEGYDDDKLIGTYYIQASTRTSERDYSISCCDIVGVLDTSDYEGGIWFEDTPLETILLEVFGEYVGFEIDAAFANSTLRGYIEPGTKRSALQQIAFALGAIADTSGTNKIRLFPISFSDAKEIPPDKTYTNGSIAVADKVTEVTVTAYVFFDERPEENQPSIELNGVQYRYYTDTKHAYNPDVIASDLQNKIKFDKSYLVNLSNAQTLANNILQYYMRRETYAFKQVLGDETPGAYVSAELPWGGTENGHIKKMTINISGIGASDTEMLLDR